MAIGLDDIKKQKKAKKKASKKKSTKKKTKPWEKATVKNARVQSSKKTTEPPKLDQKSSINESFSNTPLGLNSLAEIIRWTQKIKIQPELEIPVPDFLLTKKK